MPSGDEPCGGGEAILRVDSGGVNRGSAAKKPEAGVELEMRIQRFERLSRDD